MKFTKRKMDAFGLSNESRRQEWVKNQLLSLDPGLKILDAGAGTCQYKQYCSHLSYTSQDFNQYDPSNLNVGAQKNDWKYGQIDVISDISEIPVLDSSFDVILCTEVIEHIPNPIFAINEFARILVPGGRLILTAPFCSLTHFAPFHYSTGFNIFWYEEVLNNNGFVINEVLRNGNYFEYLAQEIRRLPFVQGKYTTHSKDISIKNKNVANLIAELELLSSTDMGSNEFLCFGYHIVATKDS